MFSFKLRINTYAVCARHSKEKISKQQSTLDRRIFKTSQTTSNEILKSYACSKEIGTSKYHQMGSSMKAQTERLGFFTPKHTHHGNASRFLHNTFYITLATADNFNNKKTAYTFYAEMSEKGKDNEPSDCMVQSIGCYTRMMI